MPPTVSHTVQLDDFPIYILDPWVWFVLVEALLRLADKLPTNKLAQAEIAMASPSKRVKMVQTVSLVLKTQPTGQWHKWNRIAFFPIF